MKSKKLTNALKDAIINKMERKLFSARRRAIIDKMEQLADEAWATLHSEDDRKFMEKAPEGAFQHVTNLSFRIMSAEGRSLEYFSLQMQNSRPVFAKYLQRDTRIVEGDVIAKKYQAIKDEENFINKEERDVSKKARSIINSVTTTMRLLEVWPEVVDFLPEEDAPTENLPAVQATELNDLIAQLAVKAEEVAA
jgi:hypothetical protein